MIFGGRLKMNNAIPQANVALPPNAERPLFDDEEGKSFYSMVCTDFNCRDQCSQKPAYRREDCFWNYFQKVISLERIELLLQQPISSFKTFHVLRTSLEQTQMEMLKYHKDVCNVLIRVCNLHVDAMSIGLCINTENKENHCFCLGIKIIRKIVAEDSDPRLLSSIVHDKYKMLHIILT